MPAVGKSFAIGHSVSHTRKRPTSLVRPGAFAWMIGVLARDGSLVVVELVGVDVVGLVGLADHVVRVDLDGRHAILVSEGEACLYLGADDQRHALVGNAAGRTELAAGAGDEVLTRDRLFDVA